MGKNKFIELKPLKDRDTVARTQFILTLVRVLVPFGLIGFIYGFLLRGIWGAIIGFLLGAILSVPASMIVMIISDRAGTVAGALYRGPKANWTIRDQLGGVLNQVRYHKMQNNFDQAFLKVEEALAKDPNFADALLLKAQILWEGFNEPIEAKRCLETIIKTTLKTNNHHLWASTLYAEIVKEEKKRLAEKQEA
jgi:tetratricopeptide (TPR) repeat protein